MGEKKKEPKLTVKQKKLLKGVMEGKSRKQAAISAGYSPASAHSTATLTLNNSKVKTAFQNMLDKAGLTDDALAKKFQELVTAKETKFFQKDGVVVETRDVEAIETQRKTAEFVAKLKGHLVEKVEHTADDGLMAVVVGALNAGNVGQKE